MPEVKVKGHVVTFKNTTNSHDRRAVQYVNKIITALHHIGIPDDDIDIPTERFGFKKVPASAWWYADGFAMHFEYKLADNYCDNLAIIARVIELEVELVLTGKKHITDFYRTFSEDEDVEEQRKEARKTLGLSEDELDLDLISKEYKKLAKKYHPDVEGGDPEMFKKVNKAHKILRRELQ